MWFWRHRRDIDYVLGEAGDLVWRLSFEERITPDEAHLLDLAIAIAARKATPQDLQEYKERSWIG